MNKKLWKRIAAFVMTCAVATSTAVPDTALAASSGNKKSIVQQQKSTGKGTVENDIAGNLQSQAKSPELNRILNECEEVNLNDASRTVKRGQTLSVQSSGNTFMAIMPNGDLYCWGYNKYGQVGNGTTENQTTPVKVLGDVKSVSCSSAPSYSHSSVGCTVSAITENGNLYCWGDNGHGQVGNGTTGKQITPVKVLSNVKSVSYSFVDYCTVSAITESGDLYCWGHNEQGQVGNGSTEDQMTPVKVLGDIKSVSYSFSLPQFCSSFPSCCTVSAITESGDLYCWGYNGDGLVGNETTENQTTPVKVLSNVKSVSYSYSYHSVGYCTVSAITESGDLYCWGYNGHGQVGNGTTENQTTPVKVLSDVKSVSYSHSYYYDETSINYYPSYYTVSAITENGDLYCWGYNEYGLIGSGTTGKQTTPVKVLSNVKSVSYSYSVYSYDCTVSAITESGDLYCWGYNGDGQVGNGTTEMQTTPVKVLSDVKSVSYSRSYSRSYSSYNPYHTVSAITKNGNLYCWGNNGSGQVGNGTTKKQIMPVKVLSDVKSVSYSFSTVSAITENGDLYCWGSNRGGQIGNGTTEQQIMPVKVLSDVKSVYSSSYYYNYSPYHTVSAITENGDLYCWGDNQYGQVGNGTTENQTTPVKILPIEDLSWQTPSNTTEIDDAKISIRIKEYNNFSHIFDDKGLENARVTIDGIGEAVTDERGKAYIKNTLTVPSEMKRITVTREGYRDYIVYSTILSPKNVGMFATNTICADLKKRKEGDDTNPYVSSVVYYQNEIAKTCWGKSFSKSDNVTFRACGVWGDKKPGYYCMYQDRDGKSFESQDGIFKINIGRDFSGPGDIYVKMVAEDGTESEPEEVEIKFPKGDSAPQDYNYVPILNNVGESAWQTDVPFLNNDKLSFDIGDIKTTIKRDGSKVRIMLGLETPPDSGAIFDDKCWSDWKKFCKSQPTDLSLSQWANVLNSDNLDTSWTANAKIKATGYGWLENDFSKDSTTPLTGGIQVVIDLGTTFKQQYLVGVIPVYMEETLGVNGKFEGSVTFDTKEKKFGGSNSIKVTTSLSVGGGVGVLYVATVGFKGSASMPITFNIPKGLTKADLEGALSLEASVLGFKYTKEWVKATYPLFPSGTAKAKKIPLLGQKKNIMDNEFSTDSLYNMKNYSLPCKIPTETKWYGESSLKKHVKKASENSSNLIEILLQTGTSPLSEPILIQEGDTTLAVFLTEDSQRAVIHRSKLVYTLYDKTTGNWSAPVAVYEDGTGDFNPYISAANGKIAVSWLDYDGNITDSSSMKEALQSSKVCHVVWNASTKSFQKASDVLSSSTDNSYNGAHPYIDANGNIAQVGIKNNAADIFGMSGDNILFMTGTYENKRLNKEFTISQGIPVSYDVAKTGTVLTAAVCIDTDKNMTTLADREIYTFSSDGTVKKMTENDTYDSAPQYAKYNGKDALYWYTDNGYQIFDVSENKNIAVDAKNMNISENFTVVNGSTNETVIVWSGADENSVYQLVASILDEKSGKWSNRVVLSGSEEDIFRPSGYFNSNGEMEFIYRKGNTTEAGSLYALQVNLVPDLQIVDAYIEDGSEIPGQNTKVFVGVQNIGTDKITKYTISVDGQTTNGTTELLPGESTLLEADYKVPDTVKYGEIPIDVTVKNDPNTANNTYSLTTGYADVAVVATENEYNNGRIVHVTVENCEAISTDAVLEVHQNARDGKLISSTELGTLKQGDIIEADFVYKKYPTGYDVDADALYYVVTSSKPEKYDSNNYDYSVFITDAENDSEDPIQPSEPPTALPTILPTALPTVLPAETLPPAPNNSVPPSSSPSQTRPSGSTGTTGNTGVTTQPTSKPSVAPIPSATVKPQITGTPSEPVITPNPSVRPDTGEDNKTSSMKKLKKGIKIIDKKTKAVYKITGTGKKRAVEYVKSTKKNPSSVFVPASVKLKGKLYKVTAVGKAAFKNSKKLIAIRLGKNVKKIGKQAFSGCTKLTNVTFGKNVTTIGINAFSKCTALNIITIPSKVTKIGNKAFYQCKNLRYILVKTNKLTAKNVGSNAFGKGAAKLRVKTDKTKWRLYAQIFMPKGMSPKALFIIDPVKLVI